MAWVWVPALAQVASDVVPSGLQAILEVVRVAGWPAALVGIAYSPAGRAIANWLQSHGGAVSQGAAQAGGGISPEVAVTLREIVLVIRQISEAQREQAEVLREVKEGLGLLLDRVPRGDAPGTRSGKQCAVGGD